MTATATNHARDAYKVDPAKKVAIVGFASSSRNDAPWNDPTFEIWGLNSLYPLIPRFTRWFEVHPRELYTKDLQRAELQNLGLDHHAWLRNQPGPDGLCTDPACGIKCRETDARHAFCPIYMQEAYDDIPASVPWPREAINAWAREMLGGNNLLRDYFTSTPGEMVATAVYEGFGEIHLYGVDLLQTEEYAYQRPGCEAWCAFAAGLGAKVVIPQGSALFKANYVYGYTEPPVAFGGLGQLVTFTEEKGRQIETAQHQEAGMANTIQGARQLLEAIKNRTSAVSLDGLDEAGIFAAKAACLDGIVGYLKIEEQNFAQRFQVCQINLAKLAGQRELAASMASWIGHYGRGGLLDGMTTPAILTGSPAVPQKMLTDGTSETLPAIVEASTSQA